MLSFGLCYALVDSGVEVSELLAKVGVIVDTGSLEQTAGTATIAYVLHKAASPIRTIPVVALTPIVAELFGKSREKSEDSAGGGENSNGDM